MIINVIIFSKTYFYKMFVSISQNQLIFVNSSKKQISDHNWQENNELFDENRLSIWSYYAIFKVITLFFKCVDSTISNVSNFCILLRRHSYTLHFHYHKLKDRTFEYLIAFVMDSSLQTLIQYYSNNMFVTRPHGWRSLSAFLMDVETCDPSSGLSSLLI